MFFIFRRKVATEDCLQYLHLEHIENPTWKHLKEQEGMGVLPPTPSIIVATFITEASCLSHLTPVAQVAFLNYID